MPPEEALIFAYSGTGLQFEVGKKQKEGFAIVPGSIYGIVVIGKPKHEGGSPDLEERYFCVMRKETA